MVAYVPAPSVTIPMMKARMLPKLINMFFLENHLPSQSKTNHMTPGIQKEKPETKRAEARESKSEKMGIASAMTQAMMVKMVTRVIQLTQPMGVLTYRRIESLNIRP